MGNKFAGSQQDLYSAVNKYVITCGYCTLFLNIHPAVTLMNNTCTSKLRKEYFERYSLLAVEITQEI